MESARFDALARRLAGTATRRTALAGLAAALSRLLPGSVAAQPRTPCREFGQVCVPERNIDCCAGTTCRNGRCRCPEGRRRCQGECRSVRRCCDGQCPGGAVCRDGRCVCPAGTRRCGERCVSRQRCCPGQKRCGERCIPVAACCGGCPATQVCTNGQCGCGTGTKPCNGRCISNDACCGGCPEPQICKACVGGVCQAANEGGACGTQSVEGGGTIRCCDGACPDPDCLPFNNRTASCGTFEQCQACCTNSLSIIGGQPYCDQNHLGRSSRSCGSDVDCFNSICACGKCCGRPGDAIPTGACDRCCSGECATATTCA